jgi:RNA polymerase sigma-70 factor (ECF subfamily)
MKKELDMILLNSIRQGDSHAFELLFKKYYAPMCLLAAKFTRDMDSAREVVQDLFVYLWENRAKVHIEYSLKAYLTSAVRHNSIRFMQQRRPDLSIDELPEDIQFADELHDSLELDELYQQLLTTIEQLPEQCKRVFKLNRFEGMKYAEIAALLNISVKTVEAHIGKALKILRKMITVTL